MTICGDPLDQVEPMIALPFHPSNAYTIREFKENMNAADLHRRGQGHLKQFVELKNPPSSLTNKLKGGRVLWIRPSSPAAPAAPGRT